MIRLTLSLTLALLTLAVAEPGSVTAQAQDVAGVKLSDTPCTLDYNWLTGNGDPITTCVVTETEYNRIQENGGIAECLPGTYVEDKASGEQKDIEIGTSEAHFILFDNRNFLSPIDINYDVTCVSGGDTLLGLIVLGGIGLCCCGAVAWCCRRR